MLAPFEIFRSMFHCINKLAFLLDSSCGLTSRVFFNTSPSNYTSPCLHMSTYVVRPRQISLRLVKTNVRLFGTAQNLDENSRMKVLCVAEKNDAAKNIANILSRGSSRRREGLSQYNKVYEFEYEIPTFGKCSVMMTSVSGHLTTIDFPATHRGWNSCTPSSLFMAPVVTKVPQNMEQVKNNILNLVKFASLLVIWTDCDREGENIGYEVINLCRQVKPSIRVLRARFSEITPRAITRAINQLVEPDKLASDAVEVRKELDLRIGAAFTRFQTLFLQNKVALNGVASYGSCQFPTLGFVVQRYKEREEFSVKPFWHLDAKHKKNGIEVNFSWERNRFFDMIQTLEYYRKVMTPPVIARVISVETKPKSKWRPLPMDTVSLEKLSSTKLKINAKAAMKIAEKLYTSGLISYPRTETNIFPPDLNLKTYVDYQKGSSQWGAYATELSQGTISPRQGKNTDKAHPPIYPTKFSAQLHGDEAKVYELICRHFLACCSRDAEGSETTVVISINGEKFKASGLVIHALNYLKVYVYEKWNGKEIPEFRNGETFVPHEIMMKQGETTPPLLLTESDLISLMEKHGIGTDATHAEHIETIKERNYVKITSDRRFLPAALGLGLVEGYNKIKDEMSKPHLRANLEKDLQAVCEGRKDAKVVLNEQIMLYKNIFDEVSSKSNILINEVKDKFDNDPDPGFNGGGGGGDGGDGGPGGDGPGTGPNTGYPKCDCQLESVKKKVQKAGPNQGRFFFTCSQGRESGCNFFSWAPDEPIANEPMASVDLNIGTRGGKKSGRGARTVSGRASGSQRKCSHCHQPGHNIKNCPNGGKNTSAPSRRGKKKAQVRNLSSGAEEFDDDDDFL